MARVAAFAILCCAVPWSGAFASDSCLFQVEAMAKTHAIVIDPPGGRAGDPPSASELGRSGGVVEPPPTRDAGVMKPQTPFPSGMPTMPDITPTSPPAGATGTTALRPADRATLQSVLVTARNHARRADEEACLRQLGEARDFVAQLPR